MNENDLTRLRDMLAYAREAVGFVAGKTRSSLDTDVLLLRALSYSTGIVGEAASHVSQETRDAHPQIPWRSAIAMRNFIFHAYANVDEDILWRTVTESLPPLIVELEKLVPLGSSEGE